MCLDWVHFFSHPLPDPATTQKPAGRWDGWVWSTTANCGLAPLGGKGYIDRIGLRSLNTLARTAVLRARP